MLPADVASVILQREVLGAQLKHQTLASIFHEGLPAGLKVLKPTLRHDIASV